MLAATAEMRVQPTRTHMGTVWALPAGLSGSLTFNTAATPDLVQPYHAAPGLSSSFSSPDCGHLGMQALTLQQTAQQVSAAFDNAEIGDELARDIFGRTSGLPAFIEQVGLAAHGSKPLAALLARQSHSQQLGLLTQATELSQLSCMDTVLYHFCSKCSWSSYTQQDPVMPQLCMLPAPVAAPLVQPGSLRLCIACSQSHPRLWHAS